MNTGACGAGGVEGLHLAIVSTEKRAKKESVLAAAKHDGLPVELASIALRADNEVVKAAVEQECVVSARFEGEHARHCGGVSIRCELLGLIPKSGRTRPN